MDFNNISVFNMANQNMRYLQAKQQVIAGNIANADTPGYLARQISEPLFKQEIDNAHRLKMKTTNSKHFSKVGSAKPASPYQIYTPQPSAALTIDGNGVILEQQMNQASKASSEYKQMISIYNKYKSMLRLANTKINA